MSQNIKKVLRGPSTSWRPLRGLSQFAGMANQMGTIQKKQPRKKRARDPNAPKKPATSYMMWLNENRNSIGEEHFADQVGQERVKNISRKAGEIWRAMTDEEKAPYISKYEEAKSEYDALMGEYTPTKSNNKVKKVEGMKKSMKAMK